MKMNWRYCITVPSLPGLPLYLDEKDKARRKITLGEARSAVFKAALQGHQIVTQDPKIGMIEAQIYIIEKAEFDRQYHDWINANAGKALERLVDEP